MKIVIAADSFKGSLSSKEVEDCLEKGIRNIDKNNISIKKFIIADGGEGTVEAVVEGSFNAKYKFIEVPGPLGKIKKVIAKYGILNDNIAVLEMAEAAGINLLKKEELNPFITTSYGVGEILKSILDAGIRKIYIGIGGSATNDGGAGMLHSLGAKFYNSDNQEIGYTPNDLKNINKIDLSEFDKRIFESEIIILCDVKNPLCGKNGASYVYGPQKGASEKEVEELDNILKKYGNVIDKMMSEKYSEKPGSGAAGGLGFALLSICKATFTEGVSKIIELINLEQNIKNADLVITGEGRIDNQTLNGKVPIGIAKIAKKYNIPVIAVVGSSSRDLEGIYNHGIDLVLDIINEPMSLEKAMKDAKILLEITGEKISCICSLIKK